MMNSKINFTSRIITHIFTLFSIRYVGDRALLALILDYDGTLTPIAPTPAMATLPAETKNLLERLSNHPDVFIAVVSGRSLQDVKAMVGIEGITYAGNHGLEILHNDGSKFVHPMPAEHQEQLTRMLKQLHEQVYYSYFITQSLLKILVLRDYAIFTGKIRMRNSA